MATELAHAYVTIIPSLKGAGKTIEKALGGIDTTSTGKSWGRSLAGGMVSTAATGVKAIGAIGLAVGGLALSGGISRALKLEEAQYKFKAMGIDAEKALESCNEAVSGTAYGLDAAAAIAAQLGTAGVQAGEQMTEALKAAAGMAAMGGVELERVGLVFSKVAATGRLQGDELMQFTEMGVNATAALAKHLGKTQSEIREMVSAGEIDFQTFADAMYATFGEAAKGANETFSGAMSNVRAALSRIGAKFATPALEGLRRLFVALIPAINAVSKVLDPLVEVFTKFTDKVTDRAVAGIEAFTEALTNTGSFLSAFKWSLDAAFEGTPIGTIIGKINGFTGAVRAGTSPVALLKAYWAEFTAFVNSGTSSAIERLREKIANLPAPIQNIISALSGFGSKVAEVFNGINVGGAVAGVGFAAFLAKFGAPLTAVVTKVLEFGTKVAGVFTKLGGFAGIFATMALKLRTFGSAVALCGGGVKGLAVVLGSGLKTALMGFLTPVNLIVIGIAALAAAFAYLMTTNESFRISIMSLVANIGTSLFPIIQIVGQALSNLASTVLPLITNAIGLIVPVLGQIITIALQLVAAIAPVITAIVGTVIPIITTIIELVVTLATQIIATIIPVIATILGVIQTAMPLIQAIIGTVCGVVLGIVNMVWPMVQSIITIVAEAVLDVIQTVMPLVQTIFGKVLPAILAIVYAVWPVIQKVIQKVMSTIEGVMNAVWPAIKGIISAAMEIIQGVIKAAMAIVQGDWKGAWNIIKDALSKAWSAIKSGVSKGISNVMNLVKDIPGKIKNVFSNAGSWLLDAGKNILSGLWNGIKSKLGELGDNLGGIGTFIAEHKGPKQYDLNLLVPNGQWIMESLTKGIMGGIPALERTLAGVTSDIQGFGSDLAPFDDVNANVKTWRSVEFSDDTSSMEEVIELLSSYLPEMAKQKQLVMDTGVVAGALTPAIDRNLGIRNKRGSKGL